MVKNTKTSFYSEIEIKEIGFKSVGKNVKISRFARFYEVEKISLGDNIRIDDFCILSGNITIGSFVHIGAYTALYGKYGIIMENFSGLSSRVTVFSVTDNYSGEALTGPCIPKKFRKIEYGLVELKKHSLVGTNSVLLPNSKLLMGATIGAMSLVKGIIPQWTIYAGVPARFMKKRNSTTIMKYEKELVKENK
ncbi:MAG: acyltransferase [Bacteroidales bacterium]|nr:acyltransferase [Bacteroidales bacterium]